MTQYTRLSNKKFHSSKEAYDRYVVPGAPDECWEWQGHIDKHGYGVAMMKRKNHFAHRLSYQLHCGPIPDDLIVCHHCDNPVCVNPAHLFLGTIADNNRDSVQKGRNTNPPRHLGSAHPKAKLTESDVQRIRALRKQGLTYTAIAKQFTVKSSTIHNICTRKIWRHIP